MKKEMRISLAICAVTALCSGGCAKEQVVKQDQMIPPATTATAEPAAKPAVAAVTPPAAKQEVPAPAPQPEKQSELQAPAPVQDAQLKAALEKVFFDFDSYTLSPEAREKLAKNAELLKQQQGAQVKIEGHCDELGSDDYNLALGEKRAQAAQRYLVGMGIAPSRLSTISYGKERPADPGHDDAARAHNRRDEFVISAK